MVHLNVRGLLARDASAVAQAVDAGSQDVMVFTETWLRRDAEAPEISGFTAVLNLPRSKRMEKRAEEGSAAQEDRQPRGGIAVYVAKTLAPSVTVLLTGPTNCYALLRIDGAVGQNEDAYLIACYIPPQGSPAFGREGGSGVWKALAEDVVATVRLGHVFVVKEAFLTRTRGLLAYWRGPISEDAPESGSPEGSNLQAGEAPARAG